MTDCTGKTIKPLEETNPLLAWLFRNIQELGLYYDAGRLYEKDSFFRRRTN